MDEKDNKLSVGETSDVNIPVHDNYLINEERLLYALDRKIYIHVHGEYYDITDVLYKFLEQVLLELKNSELLKELVNKYLKESNDIKDSIFDLIMDFLHQNIGVDRILDIIGPTIERLINSINEQLKLKADLDSNGKVLSTQLPPLNYIELAEKGRPNGVPVLDASGKIPEFMLPVQGGFVAQDTAPENTKLGWVDTSNYNIFKFYDGEKWTPIGSTWG